MIHNLEDSSNKLKLPFFITILIPVLILGILSGFILSKKNPAGSTTSLIGGVNVPKTAGVKNTKIFTDKAEGILKEGGIDGEGTFHLERPGGQSQNVYLTSSEVDLSQFIGRKIKVWGKTFEAQKAGWLMDIGYVEVLQ